ncbi:MAG: 50S ribosomal protein L11 methyltransferase [Verrucomicrobiales bacterium]
MKTTKAKPLWRLSVTVHPEAEEAAGERLERLFGKLPSIYSDLEKQVSILTVFEEGTSKPLQSKKGAVAEQLLQIEACGLQISPAAIEVKKVAREDWAESWKKHFKPLKIGSSLLVKPSWIKMKPAKGQAVVVLDPGLSFGTGQHATTSFCLRQIVAHRPKEKNEQRSFLDMGTGSGILAIAAAKLGYAPVDAFDFDPVAVEVAGKNAEVNKLAGKLTVKRADLTKLPQNSRKKYDLVCANLIYDLLLDQNEKIVNRLAPGGTLVLAGILTTQFEAVKASIEKLGLRLIKDKVEKEWRSGAFRSR